MKKLTLLVALLFTVSAMAEMPKYLEGAIVTVTLKNGKKFSYESEKMAVVPRAGLGESIGHIKALKLIVKKIKNEEIVPNKKNRLFILGGVGNTGSLKVSTNGSTYETKQKAGAVVGIGFQRKITQKINVGIQVQTNGTTSLSVGTDF